MVHRKVTIKMSSPEINIQDQTPYETSIPVRAVPSSTEPLPHEQVRAARRAELHAMKEAGKLTVGSSVMQDIERKVDTGEYQFPNPSAKGRENHL